MTATTPRVPTPPLRPRRSPGAPSAPGAHTAGSTLGSAYDARHNAFDVLRLVFAGVVALTHTCELALGWQPSVGQTQLGALAVDGFFVLSGFLVTSSWLRLRSLPRFAWHRALRILPAYWAWLLVTVLLVMPLVTVLNGGSLGALVTGPDSALTYLWRNAALFSGQFGAAGLPGSTPGGGVLNGARWTLFYEALCYIALAVVGVLGVLRHRPWLLLAGVAVLQAGVSAEALTGLDLLPGERVQRLLLMFMLGALGHLFADRVRLHPGVVALAVASLAAGLVGSADYRVLGAAGFAYLVLLAAVRLPWKPRLRTDLSYGAYLWHWPVAVVLLSTPLAGAPFAVVLVAVFAVTAAVALVSWRLVEAPALRLKVPRKREVPPAFRAAPARRTPAEG